MHADHDQADRVAELFRRTMEGSQHEAGFFILPRGFLDAASPVAQPAWDVWKETRKSHLSMVFLAHCADCGLRLMSLFQILEVFSLAFYFTPAGSTESRPALCIQNKKTSLEAVKSLLTAMQLEPYLYQLPAELEPREPVVVALWEADTREMAAYRAGVKEALAQFDGEH